MKTVKFNSLKNFRLYNRSILSNRAVTNYTVFVTAILESITNPGSSKLFREKVAQMTKYLAIINPVT